MQFGPYLALKFVNGPFLVIFKPVQKMVQNSTAEKKTTLLHVAIGAVLDPRSAHPVLRSVCGCHR